jgi:uncharacterized protein (TIGR03083 family)
MDVSKPTWDMARAERDEFVELARGLTPEQWQMPSLCEGWSVRDVVIHAGYDGGWGALLLLARSGFSVHRMNETVLDRNRSRTNDSLVATLADLSFDRVSARILGCGNCLRAMMIHQQDARRPLGLTRTIAEERLRAVLGFVTKRAGSGNLGSASRARGLRLTATDIDWTLGSGPEVRGNGEAILMAICGRRAALADLEGDGVRILAAHDVLRG